MPDKPMSHTETMRRLDVISEEYDRLIKITHRTMVAVWVGLALFAAFLIYVVIYG